MKFPAVGHDASEVKAKFISDTGGATNLDLILAVAGKKIRIVGIFFSTSAAADVLIEDEDSTKMLNFLNVTSATLSPDYFIERTGDVAITAAVNKKVIITVSGTADIEGTIYYVEQS